MKKCRAGYKLFIGALCIMTVVIARAQPAAGKAVNKILRTYNNLKNEKLAITNEYGDVEIRTWEKKQVQINITIVAEAKTKMAAKKLAERVMIKDTRDNGEITCATYIEGTDTATVSKDTGAFEKCTVTYMVYLPADLALKIKDQFGNIKMGDFAGHLEIDEKFGDVTAGSLKFIDTLHLELGSMYIKNIYNGKLAAKGFGAIKIDTISGDVHTTFSAGKIVDIGLINGSYTFSIDADNIRGINLNCAKALLANITINTKLTKFINESALVMTEVDNPEKDRQPKKNKDSLDMLIAKHDKNIPGRATVDSSKVKLLTLKKLAELAFLKKSQQFHGLSGDGSAVVRINVAFSVLKLK